MFNNKHKQKPLTHNSCVLCRGGKQPISKTMPASGAADEAQVSRSSLQPLGVSTSLGKIWSSWMMDHCRGICYTGRYGEGWDNVPGSGSVICFPPDSWAILSAFPRRHNYTCHSKGKTHSEITPASFWWWWFYSQESEMQPISEQGREHLFSQLKLWGGTFSFVV